LRIKIPAISKKFYFQLEIRVTSQVYGATIVHNQYIALADVRFNGKIIKTSLLETGFHNWHNSGVKEPYL